MQLEGYGDDPGRAPALFVDWQWCAGGGDGLDDPVRGPEQQSETGPTHNDPPIVNVRHFPRLEAGRHDDPAVHELVRARSRDRSASTGWEGTAQLELYAAPHEEFTALAPVRVGKGFRFSFAYTVDDLETVAQL
jgi:Acetoacetate decarboxylase (ADC)